MNGDEPKILSRAAATWRAAGLLLAVAGVRLGWVEAYGSELPFWDQWRVIAVEVFKPWLEGHWQWAELFAPYGEHRLAPTRLLSLLLLCANGQWDARLEMAASALLNALLAGALALVLLRVFPARCAGALLVALGLVFGLPSGWENALWGFQSCFGFLVSFSLLALWGLGTGRPFASLAWWAGLVGLGLASVSLATGAFAAAAVLGLLLWRRLAGVPWRASALGEGGTALLCAGALALAWAGHTKVADYGPLAAESPAAFVAALGRCLAWPHVGQPVLALALYAPFVVLAASYVQSGRGWGEGERRRAEGLLVLGGWVVLQAAALAYGRGGHGAPVRSRYMDLLALGTLMNFAVLLHLLVTARSSHRRLLMARVATLWTLLMIAGLLPLTWRNLARDMPEKRETMRRQEENVRGFVATGDPGWLNALPGVGIPFNDAAALAGLLSDPTLRAILPAAVRAPRRLGGTAEPPDTFVPGGFYPYIGNTPYQRAWGSWSFARGNPARGLWVSEPIRLEFPFVRLTHAGYLGRDQLALGLRDESSGRSVALRPRRMAEENWRTEELAAPGGTVRLWAWDDDPEFWLAFREPVEVGPLSFYGAWWLRRSGTLLVVGLVMLLAHPLQRWFAAGTAIP